MRLATARRPLGYPPLPGVFGDRIGAIPKTLRGQLKNLEARKAGARRSSVVCVRDARPPLVRPAGAAALAAPSPAPRPSPRRRASRAAGCVPDGTAGG